MNKFLIMLVFMICTNLATMFAQNTTLEVDNQYPGWLSSKIPFKDQASVQNLTVTGYINGTDVKFIKELINNRQLSHLDLSDANIVAGGEAYFAPNKNYSYKIEKDNTIGSYMFTDYINISKRRLTYLSLPKSVTKIELDNRRGYCDDLDTLVIGGDLKMLCDMDVCQTKKYLMIREGVDSLNETQIKAKIVHLPTTIKYLNRKTFSIDTVKANIENIDYFNNRCVYSRYNSNYEIGVLDNDTITLSENLLKWNVNAFRVKDGTTIFLNNKLKEINFDIDFGSSSTWNGGALSAKNLIIHSPSRTPIKINSKGLFSTATIYVPKGSVEAYKSQLPWSNATILEEKVPVTGIRLDKENILLSEIGETALLRATVLPEDADNKNVIWESSNEKVATVENGIVTCKGYGTAEISATTEDGGFTAVCKVTAERKEILSTSITLDKADVTMNVGETTKLKADVWPTDADNKSVIWNSDNEDIAKVSSDGVVTAVKAGKTKVYATTQANNLKAECEITVLQPVTGIEMDKASISFTYIGETVQLTAKLLPEDASNQNVTWESSDTKVAIVSKGKVVCTGFGTAVIYAVSADGGFMATCIINATTGIEGITDDAPQKVIKRYDITGREINQPVNGINIVKTEDGRVLKTSVKRK
mgnify:FL=1